MRPGKRAAVLIAAAVILPLSAVRTGPQYEAVATMPTATFTAMSDPTATPVGWGADEPANDEADGAVLIGVGTSSGGALHSGDPGDWWRVFLKGGRTYSFTAEARDGGDPAMTLYTPSFQSVVSNGDCSLGQASACLQFAPPTDGFHYVEVTSEVVGLYARYDLRVSEVVPSATPTPTPRATPSATAVPENYDAHEPGNDTPAGAPLIGVGTASAAAIHIGDPGDWWRIYLKPDTTYYVEAVTGSGGDTRMSLHSEDQTVLAASNDCGGGVSPCLSYRPQTASFYLIHVASEITGLAASYQLVVDHAAPTPTPSAVPTSTPAPTSAPNDEYEDNYDFATAAEIVLGQGVRANLPQRDNDFYRIYLKELVPVRCDVLPQGPVDPNLIVYDQWQQGVGGNDDRSAGDPASSFAWVPTSAGWHFLLVGSVSGAGAYQLMCQANLPTPTPAPQVGGGGGFPAATPTATPTPTPIRFAVPSPTPGPDAPMSTTPGGALTPLPTPRAMAPVRVVIYYDNDGNKAASPSEGISGAPVQLLDASLNVALVLAETDERGFVEFQIPADDTNRYLRVSIPYLAFSKSVTPGGVVEVRIEAAKLPGLIP